MKERKENVLNSLKSLQKEKMANIAKSLWNKSVILLKRKVGNLNIAESEPSGFNIKFEINRGRATQSACNDMCILYLSNSSEG